MLSYFEKSVSFNTFEQNIKWMSALVRNGGSSPPFFQAPTPWPSLPSLFKIFFSPPLFSVPPPLRYFRQFTPALTQPSTALIQPFNLPWFKQISKRQFYQFNCRFLSKINFYSFKSLYKQVILVCRIRLGWFLDNLERPFP